MKGEKVILILMVMALTGCHKLPEVEVRARECAALPVGGRASACACSMNGKGYVFGGRDEKGTYLNDLWEYDPTTDSWTSMGSVPGKGRVNAIIIAYKGCLYAGLGFAKGGAYEEETHLRDWWRWNETSHQWDSLAPYPDNTTICPIPYVTDGRIYAIYGAADCFTRHMTWYEVATNTWQREEDSHYRALSAFKGVGAQVQDRYYYGLGYNSTNLCQWWRVDLEKDNWTKCKSLPSKGRTCSAGCANDTYMYVFGGRYFAGEMTGGEVFADMWRYDPADDEWSRGGAMPCGKAENQIAFAIGNKVYFGLGEDEEGRTINKLYCIEE